jgi:hypothetical protein
VNATDRTAEIVNPFRAARVRYLHFSNQVFHPTVALRRKVLRVHEPEGFCRQSYAVPMLATGT